MVRSPAVYAPLAEAEAVRRQLMAQGLLRNDLRAAKSTAGIWFPTTHGEEARNFEVKQVRPRHYSELLDWDHADIEQAPRAFDALGDIVVVKVPDSLWSKRLELGEALRVFHNARAVFHDHGVTGTFRTRKLELIAGKGGSETEVAENGSSLRIDPAAAYYSPRLGDERARIAKLVSSGETAIDLFGGVAPQGVQLAKLGVAVTSVDLNPEAIRLASVNAAANKVEIELHCGDARDMPGLLQPAGRVIMNLPHGAKDFIEVACKLTAPGGVIHHHEILDSDGADRRGLELIQEIAGYGRNASIEYVRHVRNYSPQDSHFVFDLRLE